MLIRSQDKKYITTDLNIRVDETDWGNEYEVYNSALQTLGTYSTEEKAIKVLDMIQDTYKQYGTIESGWGEVHGVFNIPKVFQMPQDSEV